MSHHLNGHLSILPASPQGQFFDSSTLPLQARKSLQQVEQVFESLQPVTLK